MANQIIIDIGAVANDGTGDPLRTAFGYVNDNFSNIWSTGVANSNVAFDGNKILTVNTNGNLVLAPNGIGKVQANVDILPNANNTLNLGATDKRWNTVYTRNLDATGNLTLSGLTLTGDLTVGGNLTVNGTTTSINTANLDVEDKVITIAYGSPNASVANGSGITVAGADANIIYNDNVGWTLNKSTTIVGNINANYFYGNGSQLTGITSYGNANVADFLDSLGSNAIVTTGNITGGYFIGDGSQLTGITSYGNANVAAYMPTYLPFYTGSLAAANAIIGNLTNSNQNWQITTERITAPGGGGWYSDSATGDSLIYTAPDGYFTAQSVYANSQAAAEVHLEHSLAQIVIHDGVTQTWTFTVDGRLTVPGDISPNTSNTYSLGNATNQWSDLYVSNATIYMNNVPLSLTAGNVLTVNGADVVTTAANGESSIGNLNILGTVIEIAAGAPETLINISPDAEGWAYLQLPTDATANSANTRLHNDAGNVEIATGNFSTGSTSYQWYFNNTGSLMLPGNASANNASISSIENGSIVKLNSQANGYVGITGFGSAGNNVAAITAVGLDGETDRVIISVYNPNIDDGEAWTFNNAGDFTTAGGNIFFGTQADDAVIVPGGNGVKIAANRGDLTTSYVNITTSGITIDAIGGSTADITLRAADDIFVQGGDKTSAPGQRGGDINIDAGQGGPDNGVNAGDGGDVAIQGGGGGEILAGGSGDGGDVTLLGGTGSTANVVNLLGAGRGGLVVIQGGQGGDQAGNTSLSERGGNVDIYGGQGSFDFANTLPSGLPGHVNLYGGNWGYVNAPSGNIYLNGYDGTNFKTLTYDNVGNVTMAAGGALNFVGSSSGIVQSPNNDLIVTVQDDENDDWALYNRVTDSGTTLSETRLRRGDFQINFPGVSKDFNFNDSGVLGLPGDIALNTQGGDISLYAIDDGDSGSAELKTISYAGATLGSNVRVTQNAATISTGNAAYTWTFDNTGNLTVPGNTIVSTANATGGLGGKSISITAGASDTVTWNSNPGGNVNITGGYGSFGDGGGGPGGQVNIIGGGSSDSHAGNVTINSGTSTWTFDYTGNLTAPGNISTTGNVTANIVVATTNGNGTNFKVGDDMWLGDVNVSDTMSLRGQQNAANAYLLFGNADTTSTLGRSGSGPLTWTGNFSVTGNISGNTAGYAIGYRDIPQVSFTGNATIATTDAGKHYYSTQSTSYTLTIANNASQGFQVGSAITIVNQGTGNITVAQGSGVTLYMAGNATSGNRSVATFGMATLIKVATDTWFINGTGVS